MRKILIIAAVLLLAGCGPAKMIPVEAQKDSVIAEMRTKAQRLSMMADKLDDNTIKAKIDSMNEDLKYLSPSVQSEAYELESRMSAVIDSILSDAYFCFGKAYSTETLEAKLSEFEFLYNQRKNIYFER